MAAGSMPPTMSTPRSSAARISSAVPGWINMPPCGKATSCRSIRCLYFSRRASMASMCRKPHTVCASTWLRKYSEPRAMQCSISGPARSAMGTSKVLSRPCSLLILSLRVGPAVFGRQGVAHKVLSKCTWLSTSAGSSNWPLPSIRQSMSGAAVPAGSTAWIVDCSSTRSTATPPSGRTLRMTWEFMLGKPSIQALRKNAVPSPMWLNRR